MGHTKSHDEMLEDLNAVEEKLTTLLHYYEEKEVLLDMYKILLIKYSILIPSETSMERSVNSIQPQKTRFSVHPTIRPYSIIAPSEEIRTHSMFSRSTKMKNSSDKKVSFRFIEDEAHENLISEFPSHSKTKSKILDVVDNITILNSEVNYKLDKIQTIKEVKKSFLEPDMINMWDEKLKILESEKGKLEEKILQYVIQNVIEGKETFLHLISTLENENMELEELVNILMKKINFLEETNIGLILENARLRRNELNPNEGYFHDKIRKTLRGSMAVSQLFITPDPMIIKMLMDMEESEIDLDMEEEFSLQSKSLDSFALDEPIATWNTGRQAMAEKVKTLGKDLQVMEVTQMKLNLLKRYIQQTGSKCINRETLIDPTKGLSPWHSK